MPRANILERRGKNSMSTPADVLPLDAVGAIARCRYLVLQRADELLRDQSSAPMVQQADTLPGVSALLMTSLEELKVAEEELRVQNSVLESQRATVDQRVRHYRQLFLFAPAPAFITDIYGTIQEANLDATKLFRREARFLERKPLVTLLCAEYREEFRRQISRLPAGEGVRDWRLMINRMGDVPLEAHAAVRLVPDIGETGSGVLYWMLTVSKQTD